MKFRELYNLSFALLNKYTNETANLYDAERKKLEMEATNSVFVTHIKELAQSMHDLEEVIMQICMLDLKQLR